MKRTIFYSWQSDLPSNTNWSFIESCLNIAIKQLANSKDNPIELTFDRATREDTGSPDITESIFSKISKSSVFVADISIVNNASTEEKHRKTPNPNVLIELGYAARTLGWEKIICIYNTDYGSFENLPFDLRNRRILAYSLENKEKPKEKQNISKTLKNAILEMDSKGILKDQILDFLKKEIDQEMLGLISHFIKFITKVDAPPNFLKEITDFLNYENHEIVKLLKDKKIIGFIFSRVFLNMKQILRHLSAKQLDHNTTIEKS